MRLEKRNSGAGDDSFNLIMSPIEWKEVYALAKYGQTGLAYDCDAPYVVQVFVYEFSQPESLQSDEDTQAAFAGIDRMVETNPADGKAGGEITLGLLKEPMRQLLIVLGLAAAAEKQANLLYDAMPEKFPYPFPEIEVSGKYYYVKAFDDLLGALHDERSISINRPGK